MKTFFKAMVVLAVVCAFSSCSNDGDRPVEANGGPKDDKVGGQAVVTKYETLCTTVTVTSETEDGAILRYEKTVIDSSTASRSTRDKGLNSIIDSTGKHSRLLNLVKSDGTKTKVKEMKYSYIKKNNRHYEKKSANVFFQKDDFVIKRTADEGFFFKDKDGKQVKTEEQKSLTEYEYFDDGVTTKELSYKIDGVLQPAEPFEYNETTSKDGDYDVTVETLKAPHTEDGTTTESDVRTCKHKALK